MSSYQTHKQRQVQCVTAVKCVQRRNERCQFGNVCHWRYVTLHI